MICEICKKEVKNKIGLSSHITKQHKEIIKLDEYYKLYISKDENDGICVVCGKDTKFLGIGKGFSRTCSLSCSQLNSETRKNIEETCLKKYGVKHATKSKVVSDKLKNVWKNMNIEEKKKIQNNREKTCLERYNVKNPTLNKEIRQRVLDKTEKNYGNKHIFKTQHFKEKSKKTCLERYGVENAAKNETIIKKVKDKSRFMFYKKLISSDRLMNKCEPLFDINEYNGVGDFYKWKCKKCNKEFEGRIINGRIPRCLNCYPIFVGYSKMEKEISQFIKDNGFDIKENIKSTIPPYELDIYIPSHNLAIELNGLYWHSEINGNKNKDYHLNKTKLCREKGIQLVHIFEDEWLDKQNIVKSIILNKLGKSENKIYARNTIIKSVDYEESYTFLNNNHIQGYIRSKINLGLYYEDKLVCLMCLSKPRYNKNYEWEILRFCNIINSRVIGGFSKLLKFFIKKYNPNNIITYADFRYSFGGVYKNNNFKYIGISKPNYFYLYEDFIIRDTRLNFQKHKLKDKLEIFDSKLTEWQNMQLNGYDRIWDCGNLVYCYGIK